MSNKGNPKSANQLIFEERIYLAVVIGCFLGALTGLWSIAIHEVGGDLTLLSKASVSAVILFLVKALLDKAYVCLFVPFAVKRAARSGIARTEEDLVMHTPLPEIVWPIVILSSGIAFTAMEFDLGHPGVVCISAWTGLFIGLARQWSDKWQNLQARR